MKIRNLGLTNIGVFDDEQIFFRPCPTPDKAEIHILTGQNGTGKSTILMALANLFDIEHFQEFRDRPDLASQSINLYRNSLYKRLRLGSSTIRYSVEDAGLTGDLEFNFNRTPNQFSYINKFNRQDKVSKQLIDYSERANKERTAFRNSVRFVAFAMSGYRKVRSESVNALAEPTDFNPLWQCLNFDKSSESGPILTINQLLANNISKSAIERGRDDQKARRFAEVVESIEFVIQEVTGWKVRFDLLTEPTHLVTILNDKEVEFDVLPDGLKSLISWIADILCRIDLLTWRDGRSILQKEMLLFLDEIEVHLHPAWQRKVLPVIQSLFKNSQIFVSTHSPFVINSVDDAWVYKIDLLDGAAKVSEIIRSEEGSSYQRVLAEVMGVDQEFGGKTQDDLDSFLKIVHGQTRFDENHLLDLARALASQSEELNSIVQIELKQLERRRSSSLAL